VGYPISAVRFYVYDEHEQAFLGLNIEYLKTLCQYPRRQKAASGSIFAVNLQLIQDEIGSERILASCVNQMSLTVSWTGAIQKFQNVICHTLNIYYLRYFNWFQGSSLGTSGNDNPAAKQCIENRHLCPFTVYIHEVKNIGLFMRLKERACSIFY
jgi:hypothetical protein